MRPVLKTLLVITALFTVFLLLPHSGSSTPAAYVLAILSSLCVLLCFAISAVGALVSIADLRRKIVPRESAIVTLCLSLVFPGTLVLRAVIFHAQYDAVSAWSNSTNGPAALNFWLRDYVSAHPVSVSYPYPDSEEVLVSGFADYVKENVSLEMRDHEGRSRDMQIRADGIYTSWGAKIHFAIDRNQDGYIEAAGQKVSDRPGFANPDTDRPDYRPGFASAVFVAPPDPILKAAWWSMLVLDTETYSRRAPEIHMNMKH